MYELGIIMGFLLLIAKVGSSYYLTGGEKQWPVKRLIWSFIPTLPLIATNYWLAIIPILIIFYFGFKISQEEKEMGVRDWCYNSNVRKGIIDLIAGYLGMHVLAAFGGSIIAMISMVTYTITCMALIYLSSIIKKGPPRPKRRRKYAFS